MIIDTIDVILDPNNTDDVVLYDDNDKPIVFEQVALIPLFGRTYAILKPIVTLPGTNEDDAFAFEINKDKGIVQLVEDDDLIDTIFREYRDMYNNRG